MDKNTNQTQFRQLVSGFKALSPDHIEEIITLKSQSTNQVYSVQQIFEILTGVNARAYWDQLAPHFPICLDRKTHADDLKVLNNYYAIKADQLVITNRKEISIYNKLITAARYGLVDFAEEVLEYYEARVITDLTQDPVNQPIPDCRLMILDVIEEAIKHDQPEIAKLAIDHLKIPLTLTPELVRQLIVIVCRNGCLPVFQYCEQQLGTVFTEKV